VLREAGVTPDRPASKSLGKRARRGVAWSFLREGVTEVLLFPASMVMARLLTPEEFGVSAAALFFIQLAARLGDMGFNAALVRSKLVTEAHLSSVFVVHLCFGALACGTLVAAAPLVATFYGIPETGQIIRVASVTFLITPLGAVPGALLTRHMRFRETSLVDWFHCVAFAATSVGLAWMGFSFWSLVYGRMASMAVKVAARVYYARWRPSLKFEGHALRDVVSFGLGMHTRRLLEYAAGNLDNLMIGKLMGMTALGLYDKAFSTVDRFLTRLNTGGPAVMFRVFSIIHEDPARFQRGYARAILSASLLGVPFFAVLIATAPQLIVVLFGPAWTEAAPAFQLLCAAAMLRVLNAYASSAAMAAGRVWSEVWRQVAYVALMVAGIVIFRDWGPTGAAAAVLLATSAMTVLMHMLLRRVARLTWSQMLAPQAPAVMCAAGAVAVVLVVEYALRTALGTPSNWLLLACQALTVGVFCGAFVLFAPHAALRALVHETTADLAPGFLRRHRWVRWYLQAYEGR
jgi:PST family polysaccharide transporter